MTGNVVILGMAAAGGTELSVLNRSVALVCFFVGAVAAGRVLRTADPGWSRRCSALLGGVGLTMAATAIGVAIAGVGSPTARLVTSSVLALAMGAQAATARHIGVKDVNTVVVTMTLTALAAESRLGMARGLGEPRRAAVLVLLASGAVAGAVLCRFDVAFAVAAAASLVLAVTVLGDGRRGEHA